MPSAELIGGLKIPLKGFLRRAEEGGLLKRK